MEAVQLTAKDYKSAVKPIWCPGCGDYSVLAAITNALAEHGRPLHDVAVISGIGCSSRIPAYTSVYGFHGVHGRSLALASGVKLARPDLTVLVAGGDGDGLSIGGNHFLHACRRNVDMTYVIMDNQVYGMTKGQASPTTDADWTQSKLTPEGTGVNPVQPLTLALAAGAQFIARGFSGNPRGLAKLIYEGINHPGFSIIQVMSPCITYRPEQRDWKSMMKDSAYEATDNLAEANRRLLEEGDFSTGVIYKGPKPAFNPIGSGNTPIAEIEKEFAL